eukprot:1063457-Prorocentrum_minimum.AAC.2
MKYIPTLPGSDWSVVGIYPHFLDLIGHAARAAAGAAGRDAVSARERRQDARAGGAGGGGGGGAGQPSGAGAPGRAPAGEGGGEGGCISVTRGVRGPALASQGGRLAFKSRSRSSARARNHNLDATSPAGVTGRAQEAAVRREEERKRVQGMFDKLSKEAEENRLASLASIEAMQVRLRGEAYAK